MLKVKVAFVMAVGAVRRIVAIFKAPEYSRASPCQQHTLWWGSSHVLASSCGVVMSTILFPFIGGLVVFLFLASTYNWIGQILRRRCLLKLVIKLKKGREDEVEDVNTYPMTLRRREDT